MRLSVQDVQIDYCDYNSDSPVLLHRTMEPGADKKELVSRSETISAFLLLRRYD